MGAAQSQDKPCGYSDIDLSNIASPVHSNNTKAKGHFTLFARDLSIKWAENDRAWRWLPLKESSDEFEVAELLTVAWLEVHGRFEVANLSPGTVYEVVFVVMLRPAA